MKISKRVKDMQYSAIRELVPLANKTKADGIIVNHLNIGVPDLATPQVFLDKVKDFQADTIGYAPSLGLDDLRLAVVNFFKNQYHLDYNFDEVVITGGASEALMFTLMTLCDYGDNIITANPYYSNYLSYFNQAGVKLKVFDTHLEDNFNLPKVEEIINQIDKKTKAILICNPNNPTGKVYTKAQLTRLVEIALKYDLYLIGDEIYRDYIYDSKTFTSLGEFIEAKDHVVLIDSVSKRFSACGLRIGAILSKNKDLMAAFSKLATARLALPTLDQVGAVELYNLENTYLKSVLDIYTKRRDLTYKLLVEIDGVKVNKPEGAFYIMAKLPVKDSKHFSKWLLTDFSYKNETVMVAPAGGFYLNNIGGESEVRIAFATEKKIINQGIRLLDLALREYKKEFE